MTTTTQTDVAYQQCIAPTCGAQFSIDEVLVACPQCGSLLDIDYNWDQTTVPKSLRDFEAAWSNRQSPLDYSGVWRFRSLLPFAADDQIVTIGEGQTILQHSPMLAKQIGLKGGNLHLQYEGLNPSGSFKDNGMTAAATHAQQVGAKTTACASTGNTSASLAIYAGTTGLFKAIVFVGSGKIAYGKLSQALDYGAATIQIEGDFDDAMIRVREVCAQEGIYLCNSVNPFRLEGQKTIMYRVLEGLNWEVPDWIVVPGGNLGNSSAFGKAFHELHQLGLIDRIPRLAVITADGADTLYQVHEKHQVRWNNGSPQMDVIDSFYAEMDAENRNASTLATAIQVNRPVSLLKSLRALEWCDGVVRSVSDQAIMDAKALIGRHGFGCEPASAASLAGTQQLREEGVISDDERVVCILTGHELKDPNATVAYHSSSAESIDPVLAEKGLNAVPHCNRPVGVKNDLAAITELIRSLD